MEYGYRSLFNYDESKGMISVLHGMDELSAGNTFGVPISFLLHNVFFHHVTSWFSIVLSL